MKTIINLRDLGGYATESGRIIKHHKLLRSGELSNISLRELNVLLNSYRLHTIIDFRSNQEIENHPDKIIPTTIYKPIDIMKNFDHQSLSIEAMIQNAEDFDPLQTMCEVYEHIVLDTGAQEGYREFFSTLCNHKEGAVLFHCSAGKDRTGIGAAYLLKILGVSKVDIYHDYLLTNKERKDANKQIVEQALKQGLNPNLTNALHTMLSVDRTYLDTVFKTIDDYYDSFDNYKRTILSIDEEMESSLIELYTQIKTTST